jgi:iron complex outermembrane receptor protein
MLNAVFNPVDLKLRGNLSWKRGPLSLTVFVNYTDGYDDGRDPARAGVGQRARVASWTTFDLTAAADCSALGAGWSRDLVLTFTALNALDRDPPYISSPSGIHFDGANAQAIGRTVALQMAKQW